MARGKRRPKGNPPIFRRSDRGGVWYVSIQGRQRSLRTTDRAEALRRAAALLADRDGPMDSIRVADLCARFLAQAGSHSRGGFNRYRRLCGVLIERFGRQLARDIRPDQLQALLRDPDLTTGGPATRNRLRTCLRRLFEFARELGAGWPNPVGWRPERERGRPRRPFTEDEVARLLETARRGWHKCPPSLAALVRLALVTGLRRGELLALEGRDLDREARVLTLHSTKSGAHRRVRLPADLVEELPAVGPDAPFFADPRRSWPTLLRRARIGDRAVCFHSLRHTFSYQFLLRGGSLLELRDILGHASLATTERYVARIGAPIELEDWTKAARKAARASAQEERRSNR